MIKIYLLMLMVCGSASAQPWMLLQQLPGKPLTHPLVDELHRQYDLNGRITGFEITNPGSFNIDLGTGLKIHVTDGRISSVTVNCIAAPGTLTFPAAWGIEKSYKRMYTRNPSYDKPFKKGRGKGRTEINVQRETEQAEMLLKYGFASGKKLELCNVTFSAKTGGSVAMDTLPDDRFTIVRDGDTNGWLCANIGKPADRDRIREAFFRVRYDAQELKVEWRGISRKKPEWVYKTYKFKINRSREYGYQCLTGDFYLARDLSTVLRVDRDTLDAVTFYPRYLRTPVFPGITDGMTLSEFEQKYPRFEEKDSGPVRYFITSRMLFAYAHPYKDTPYVYVNAIRPHQRKQWEAPEPGPGSCMDEMPFAKSGRIILGKDTWYDPRKSDELPIDEATRKWVERNGYMYSSAHRFDATAGTEAVYRHFEMGYSDNLSFVIWEEGLAVPTVNYTDETGAGIPVTIEDADSGRARMYSRLGTPERIDGQTSMVIAFDSCRCGGGSRRVLVLNYVRSASDKKQQDLASLAVPERFTGFLESNYFLEKTTADYLAQSDLSTNTRIDIDEDYDYLVYAIAAEGAGSILLSFYDGEEYVGTSSYGVDRETVLHTFSDRTRKGRNKGKIFYSLPEPESPTKKYGIKLYVYAGTHANAVNKPVYTSEPEPVPDDYVITADGKKHPQFVHNGYYSCTMELDLRGWSNGADVATQEMLVQAFVGEQGVYLFGGRQKIHHLERCGETVVKYWWRPDGTQDGTWKNICHKGPLRCLDCKRFF